MSLPVQGNQFFTNVQNSASLSVQNLNVDSLEASQITLGVLTSNPSSTPGSQYGQLALFYYSSAWSLQVWNGSSWTAL